MKIGFDTPQESNTICLAKQWPERNIAAGFLLCGYGTVPAAGAISDNGITTALMTGAGSLQNILADICNSGGAADLRYAATRLTDALIEINIKIRSLSALLGQGLYLGGVITYFAENDYVLIPFGGGCAYTWDGSALIRQGSSALAAEGDRMIRDALGCHRQWQGTCWQGTLPQGKKLLCFTGDTASRHLLPHLTGKTSYGNTLSMLIRRELEKHNSVPVAVMEFSREE